MTKVSVETSEAGLIRGIRRWDLVAIAINGIIGAGIFGLPSKVFSLIGSYSLIAFIVCAVVVTLIILCFAEVGSRFDETGGPYLYAREAFGPGVAFEIGWLIWLARLTAFAANVNLLVAYTFSHQPVLACLDYYDSRGGVSNDQSHWGQAGCNCQQRVHCRQTNPHNYFHRRRSVFSQSSGVRLGSSADNRSFLAVGSAVDLCVHRL